MNAAMNNRFTLDELIKQDKKSKKQKSKQQKAVVSNQAQNTGKGKKPANRSKKALKVNQAGGVVKPRIKGRAGGIYKKKVAAVNPEASSRLAARRLRRNLDAKGGRAKVVQAARVQKKVAAQRKSGANKQKVNNQLIKKVLQQQQQQQQQRPQQQIKQSQQQDRLQPTRLKVRNVDEKKISEQEILRLFSKKGQVIKAKFDKNQYGQYLGSATVVYDRLTSAQAAIHAYDGAQIDDRVITVEIDVPNKIKKQIKSIAAPLTNQSVKQIPKVKKTANAISKKQQQAKVGQMRQAKQKQGSRRSLSAGKTLNVRRRKTDRK